MTPFRIKPFLVTIPVSEHVSFSDEGLLLKTLEFLTIALECWWYNGSTRVSHHCDLG